MFRHQVSGIGRATDLFDPVLFVLLFLLQQKVLCLHVFDGAAPRCERASPGAATAPVQILTWASCPSSRIVLVNPMASLAPRTMLQYSDSALLSDAAFCVDDQVAKVC